MGAVFSFIGNSIVRNRKEAKDANTPSTESLVHAATSNSSIDDQIALEIANSYLANANMNNLLIPDALEAKLYICVVKMLFGMLQETSKTAFIDLLGHRIRFVVEPLPRAVAVQC